MDDEKKSAENNLDLRADLNFVNGVLRSIKVQAEPDAKFLLLKEAYTMVRDMLVEARRFADKKNKCLIDEEDLRVANVENLANFEDEPMQPDESIVQTIRDVGEE